ncbi:MAG: methyltransferase [Chitinophagaceae bacterium]
MQTELQSFTIGNQSIGIFVPDSMAIQEAYKKQHTPYWAQVWHAAIGLCIFLQQHPEYIKNRTVLELGAGLGLPGIVAAATAKDICISDKSPEVIAIVQQSVLHHQLNNVSCKVIDWNDIDAVPVSEVVLLSDINYEPDAFAALTKMIVHFLDNNCTIILCTPQRLMGKAFVESLLAYCITNATIPVQLRGKQENISVFVLVKK